MKVSFYKGLLNSFMEIINCTFEISKIFEAIVLRGNCPTWELSCVGIVLRGNCPTWELSYVGIVLRGNCPTWELSHVGIVLCRNCPCGNRSVGNYRDGNCLSENYPAGNCPRWELSAHRYLIVNQIIGR